MYLLPDRYRHSLQGLGCIPHCCLSEAFGINNASTAAEIYQYIVETPGNYLKYYWGYLNFLDLKTVCQKRLGDDFEPERISPPDSGHRTCTVSGSGKIHEINELLFTRYGLTFSVKHFRIFISVCNYSAVCYFAGYFDLSL